MLEFMPIESAVSTLSGALELGRTSPTVVVIDDGELADVHDMLESAGVGVSRVPGASARDAWRQPARLLVVSGRRAMGIGRPVAQESPHFTTLAVCPEASRTLRAELMRLGYDLVVERPVHTEALQQLVTGALFAGPEQRAEVRRPLGIEVAWRDRLRRVEGVLVELSSTGCTLLIDETVRPGLGLTFRLVTPTVEPIKLKSRVVRWRQLPGRERRVALSVIFGRVDRATATALEELLVAIRSGPLTLAPPTR